jgi:hypothetical protein
LADDEPNMGVPGMVPIGGRGLSTMTRPTTWVVHFFTPQLSQGILEFLDKSVLY